MAPIGTTVANLCLTHPGAHLVGVKPMLPELGLTPGNMGLAPPVTWVEHIVNSNFAKPLIANMGGNMGCYRREYRTLMYNAG